MTSLTDCLSGGMSAIKSGKETNDASLFLHSSSSASFCFCLASFFLHILLSFPLSRCSFTVTNGASSFLPSFFFLCLILFLPHISITSYSFLFLSPPHGALLEQGLCSNLSFNSGTGYFLQRVQIISLSFFLCLNLFLPLISFLHIIFHLSLTPLSYGLCSQLNHDSGTGFTSCTEWKQVIPKAIGNQKQFVLKC